MLGASGGCAVVSGKAAEALGASGAGSALAGGGVVLAVGGPGGASDLGQLLFSSSTMVMTSPETRCC